MLIRYRRAGGMAGLDQRLTIGEDGRIVLDDRKSRGRSEVQASDSELETVRSLIDQVPENRWHGIAAAIGKSLLPRHHEAMRFEVRTRHGRITGNAGAHDADLAPLLSELDELLARAVRQSRAGSP